MIDSNFKLYLIEANTNPCLEVSAPLLSRIIPSMLDSALKYSCRHDTRLAVDPLFPLIETQTIGKRLPSQDVLTENKFQLTFDEKVDAKLLEEYVTSKMTIEDSAKC